MFNYCSLPIALTILVTVVSTPNARAQPWDPPAILEHDSGTVQAPRIYFDPAGNAWAFWAQERVGVPSIRALLFSRKDRVTGQWSRPQLLRDYTDNASTPSVVLDHSKNLLAVWLEGAGGYTRHVAYRFFDASEGKWSEVDFLSQAGAPFGLRLVGTQEGNAVAVWMMPHPMPQQDTSDMWSARWDMETKQWVDRDVINDDIRAETPSTTPPDLALNENFEGMVVFAEFDGDDHRIRSMQLEWPFDWTGPTSLATEPGDSRNPKVAINDTGEALVVWQQGPLTPDALWAAHRSSAGSWDIARVVGGSRSPSVAATHSGDFIVAWQYWSICPPPASYGKWNIAADRFRPDLGWLGPIQLINSCIAGGFYHGDSKSPQIAAGAFQQAAVVWRENNSNPEVWANVMRNDLYGSAVRLDAAPISGYLPHVAVHINGEVGAVWVEQDREGEISGWASFTR